MCMLEVDLEQHASVGKLPGALLVHIVAPCAGEDAVAGEACARKVRVKSTRLAYRAPPVLVTTVACPLSEHTRACTVHGPLDTALS
jgi:hypothetical protein